MKKLNLDNVKRTKNTELCIHLYRLMKLKVWNHNMSIVSFLIYLYANIGVKRLLQINDDTNQKKYMFSKNSKHLHDRIHRRQHLAMKIRELRYYRQHEQIPYDDIRIITHKQPSMRDRSHRYPCNP